MMLLILRFASPRNDQPSCSSHKRQLRPKDGKYWALEQPSRSSKPSSPQNYEGCSPPGAYSELEGRRLPRFDAYSPPSKSRTGQYARLAFHKDIGPRFKLDAKAQGPPNTLYIVHSGFGNAQSSLASPLEAKTTHADFRPRRIE